MFGTLDQAAQPVRQKLLLDLQATLERYGISACYAFGSRALEIAARLKDPSYYQSAGPSDLDIGVEPIRGRKLSVKEKVKLTIALEDLFAVPRVDLVLVSEADPFLALDIVRGELIYCRDHDQQAEHELYILRRAADLAPFQRARMRQILEMTPSQLRARVVSERISWIKDTVSCIKALPLEHCSTFCSDRRNLAAAESFLRRGLEALLDLGRHILAKGFGEPAVEYKEIASALAQKGVLTQGNANLLRELAGYRNRMVHFYHEISDQELYDICTRELGDIESVLKAMEEWINSHPEMIDHAL